MAVQELEIWCRSIVLDGATETNNRRDIVLEESENGWVRLGTVSTQQMNSLFYNITTYSPPFAHVPFLMPDTVSTPSTAIDADGGSFLEVDAPNLYEIYSGTMPDMTSDAPSGFKFVFRKS